MVLWTCLLLPSQSQTQIITWYFFVKKSIIYDVKTFCLSCLSPLQRRKEAWCKHVNRIWPLCVYGDPAYPLRVHLQGPFKNAYLTPQMQQFNKSVSEVRISVEWLFNDIINYFKFMDFKKNLKVGLSSVGKMYIVSGLLRNALTCLYGNSTSKFFDIQPPSLEDYFA